MVVTPAVEGCAPNLNGAVPVEAARLPEPNAKLGGDVAVAPLAGAAAAAAPNVKPPLFGWAPMPVAVPSGDCKVVEPKAGGEATVAGFAVAAPEPKLNIFVLAVLVACVANGVIWDTGAVAPNLNAFDAKLVDGAGVLLAVPTGNVAGCSLEPNLNGCAAAASVLEPNWKSVEPGRTGAAALEVATLVLLDVNVGSVAGVPVAAPAGAPKAGELGGAFGTTMLPPNDGPENTKPPAGWSGLVVAVAVKLGADDAAVDEAGRAGTAVDATGGNWNGVDKVDTVVDVFGEAKLAKPARSGFAVVEGAVVGSSVLGAVVDATLWLAGVLRPKKPAPN